ncbi:Mitochondrial inner membrane protein OXA1L [Anthophora quadrimaculata]
MLSRLSVQVGRKLLNTTAGLQKIADCQFSRLACNSLNIPAGSVSSVFKIHKNAKVYGVCIVRHQSTVDTIAKEAASTPQPGVPLNPPVQQAQTIPDNTVNDAVSNAVNNAVPQKSFISEIPDPPAPLGEQIIEAVKLHANGEVTFDSIGLGGWGPIGIMQSYFEWIHITCDMPWWGAIILTSVIVKLVTIPFTVDVMRNSAKMQNVVPEMVQLQENLTEARNSGNAEEAALCSYELQAFFKKHKIKIFPLSNVARFAVHIPIFIALRGMANAPVESLKYGGVWWFTDLTIADPYYLLPICTTATLYLVTEYAMHFSGGQNMSPVMRNIFRGLPIVSFVFAINFPGAVLLHWATSNIVTVAQNEVFKNERVKKYFNIPLAIKHKERTKNKVYKSFTEAFSESWSNMRVSNKLANQVKADLYQFNDAGKAPVRKTFKYNPVKTLPSERSATSVSAMKK